jgi:hypothetical protein
VHPSAAGALRDKMKKEWRKGRNRARKDESLVMETKKERMVFKMEVWEKSMRRLCWIYKEQKQLREALENN